MEDTKTSCEMLLALMKFLLHKNKTLDRKELQLTNEPLEQIRQPAASR